MFANDSCELTIPKSVHTKKESASTIVPTIIKNKHVETTTLMNNTSQSTLESPHLEQTCTRVSSTIMSGSISTQVKKDSNAMSVNAHETTISIQQRAPIKAIRIERDYSLGDGITRFQTTYPIELTGKISPEEFQHTITEINKLMDYADRLSWRIVLENIIETLSIYTWPIFFSTHYQRAVKRLLLFIESENNNVYYPHTLSISDPVKAAFLFIEINFYE